MIIKKSYIRTKIFAHAMRVLLLIASDNATATVNQEESTLAYQLLKLETEVGNPAQDSHKILSAAIRSATKAAREAVKGLPESKEEAIAVFQAVNAALSKKNFLQPRFQRNWPDTLGVAFKKIRLDESQLTSLIQSNGERGLHTDRKKPIYYVDCDIGALLFITVGEHLGWDIRLVEVPNHNFVRWHISDDLAVNWDWTDSRSYETADYEYRLPDSIDPRIYRHWLKSLSAKETRAYYEGLIAQEIDDNEWSEKLFQNSLTILPNHPLTLNNYAWFIATTKGMPREKTELAVRNSLAAWSLNPTRGNFADTVACSLSAHGEKELAIAISKYAINETGDGAGNQAFLKNLKKIQSGELCE